MKLIFYYYDCSFLVQLKGKKGRPALCTVEPNYDQVTRTFKLTFSGQSLYLFNNQPTTKVMSGSNRSHHSLSRPLDSLFMVHTALYWKRIGGEMKFNELKRLQSCIQAFQRAYFLMMDSHQRGTSISTPAVPTVEVYTNNNYSISVVLNLV